MTAVLVAFVAGCMFATVCAGFVAIINRVAVNVAAVADRKAAERTAASTFCHDWIPDSGQMEPVIASMPTLGDPR